MNLRGNHKASLNGTQNAPFHLRNLTTAFFIAVFAHAAIQLSFTDAAYSLGEILGIEQHDPINAIYQPVHDAPHPGTTLPIAEIIKGSEVQEKPPIYKVYNFYYDFDLVKSASIGTVENIHRGFLRSLQNRPTLSLFILHHSWKSYLS